MNILDAAQLLDLQIICGLMPTDDLTFPADCTAVVASSKIEGYINFKTSHIII